MKKIFAINIIVLLTLMSSSFAATTSNDAKYKVNNKDGENIKFVKAAKLIKSAKKLDKKGKTEKAKKKYKKALEYLVKANGEKPMEPDILNYLGFASRKLGDYENAEIYYLLGLNINPQHIGINEYLGELYVVTKRMDLALERLNVLKNCKCEEYKEFNNHGDCTSHGCCWTPNSLGDPTCHRRDFTKNDPPDTVVDRLLIGKVDFHDLWTDKWAVGGEGSDMVNLCGIDETKSILWYTTIDFSECSSNYNYDSSLVRIDLNTFTFIDRVIFKNLSPPIIGNNNPIQYVNNPTTNHEKLLNFSSSN